MNYIAMGRQIRKQRQLAGLTQERLAADAEISASFLGHIERGSRKASLETLVKIANTLNVGVDVILIDSLNYTMRGYDKIIGHMPPRICDAINALIYEFNEHFISMINN